MAFSEFVKDKPFLFFYKNTKVATDQPLNGPAVWAHSNLIIDNHAQTFENPTSIQGDTIVTINESGQVVSKRLDGLLQLDEISLNDSQSILGISVSTGYIIKF